MTASDGRAALRRIVAGAAILLLGGVPVAAAGGMSANSTRSEAWQGEAVSFASLGVAPDTWRPGGARDYRTIGYLTLPAGSKQGPDPWYVVEWHVRVRFSASSTDGLAYATLSTNGATCCQAKFVVHGDGSRRRRIEWSTFGLVDRLRTGVSKDNTITLKYSNYLRNQGVRPGRNRLAIGLECFEGARIEEISILGDSRFYRSKTGPYPVSIQLETPKEPLYVGEDMAIPVTVRDTRHDPIRDAVVTASSHGEAVALVGEESITAPATNGLARATITVRAREPGLARLTVGVSTSANDPSAIIELRVAERPRDLDRYAYGAAAVLFVVAGVGAYASRRLAVAGRGRQEGDESVSAE